MLPEVCYSCWELDVMIMGLNMTNNINLLVVDVTGEQYIGLKLSTWPHI